jgi:cytochrome c-type biogenesis protein CcmH
MKIIFFLLLSVLHNTIWADIVQDVRFNSPELQSRYQVLVEEIRCPVCQGQSIGGSNAPLAQDLRKVVEQMLTNNKTDDEIFTFMRERYGDFVVFEPPVNNQTYILWFAPFMFVVIAIIVLIRRKKPQTRTQIDTKKAEEMLKN